MGLLVTAAVSVAALALIGTGFVRYAINECKSIKISDQNGKVFLITGANSGLGFHTSLALAKANGTVIMACRSNSKGVEAKNEILKQVPHAKIDVMVLDLSSFQSIRTFVDEFGSKYADLDVLVNNAGIMAIPKRELTKDGIESQIGTNHFGHFLLTGLMLPKLKKNGRIVNHSSSAHMFATSKFPYENMLSEKNYDPWAAYGNSKMANLLFTYELNRRLQASGNKKNLISIAVHPGYTATNLQVGAFPLWEYANALIAMKGEDGALSQIVAAAGENVQPSYNNYIGPKYTMLGAPAVQDTKQQSHDKNAWKFLWEQSVLLTGENFNDI